MRVPKRWIVAAIVVVAGVGLMGMQRLPPGEKVLLKSHMDLGSDQVIYGDSIALQSAPIALCGTKLFDAGVGGTGVEEALALSSRITPTIRPKRVVIALGVNDARKPHRSIGAWNGDYLKLATQVGTNNIVLVEINPIEIRRLSLDLGELDEAFITEQNAAIRQVAIQRHAILVPAPTSMPTKDGLHPTNAGVDAWRARLSLAACPYV